MTVKNETRLNEAEFTLAVEITSASGNTGKPTDLGQLLRLAIGDPTLAAARDQLSIAILERTSEAAPGTIRALSPHGVEGRTGVRGALAAQGLEINSTFIRQAAERLASVRLLIDTAAGQAVSHYRAFGIGDHPYQVDYPRERAGQWRLKADLRGYGGNPETAALFAQYLARTDPTFGRRIEMEADGFETTFWAKAEADIRDMRSRFDAFARETFIRPPGR